MQIYFSRMFQMDAKEMEDALTRDVSYFILFGSWTHSFAMIAFSKLDNTYLLLYTRQPNYVRTIEDEVELQRQKKLAELKAKGIKGTPVTPETFKAWQERKRKRKQDAAKKLVEAELKKKKGGKGLSILSGRDLFEYKKDLFKDDDDFLDGVGASGAGSSGMTNKNGLSSSEEKKSGSGDGGGIAKDLEAVVEKVQSDLFLEGDDDDLDDLDDD